MTNDNAGKIRRVIDRPDMFLVEGSLTYAVAFISGLNWGSEGCPLEGFRQWLSERYFGKSMAQAWEALIPRLPECATGNEADDVKSFLKIVETYLDSQQQGYFPIRGR